MLNKDVTSLLEHTLNLSADDRAAIAERLLASLDELSPAEAERIWVEEAIRRLGAFHAGTARSVPAAEVHTRAWSGFPEVRADRMREDV